MIHAVTAPFSTALTVALMLVAVAAGAVLLFGAFALIGPALGLLFAGIGAAFQGLGRLPRLTARGCLRLGQYLVVRLPGPQRWHRWVARHPKADQGARMRLVRRRHVPPALLQEVFVNTTTTESVRVAVVRRCTELGGVAHVMPTVARDWWPHAFAWPLTYADDAVLVQQALRNCLRLKDRSVLRSGYARLARLAGPEAVWAMELEYAGSLERMDPVVRSSMQAGDTDVLLKWLD